MIEVFTLNKNNKIELSKEELKELLDKAYWEGYHNNHNWTYVTPSLTPYYTWTTSGSSSTVTLTSNVNDSSLNNIKSYEN